MVLLVSGSAWLDYRGAALIARHYLLREAGRMGLSGDVIVSGTLLHGLTIESLQLSGDGPVREIEIKRLRASWNWREISSGKIQSIDGDMLRIVIDKDAQTSTHAFVEAPTAIPVAESADKSWANPMARIRAFWSTYAQQVEVEWRGIDVRVRSGDRELIALGATTLRHRPGEDTLQLDLGEVKTCKGPGLAPQEVTLGLTERGFSLNRLTLPGGIAICEMEADAVAMNLSAEFTHGDAVARLELDAEMAQLALKNGTLDLRAALTPWTPWPESANGSLETFGLHIVDWSKGPSQWLLLLEEAQFTGLTYDRWLLPKASVKARWVERVIHLEASGEAGHSPFTLGANLRPHDPSLSSGLMEVNITSARVGDLFSTLRDRFLPEARALPVPEGELTAKAFCGWGNRTWNSLRATARTENWRLGERKLPDVEGEFTWDSSADPMKVSLQAPGSDEGGWKAEATWEMAAQVYNGMIHSGGSIDARPWLELAGCFTRLPETTLPIFSIDWKGHGAVRTNEHRGELALDVPTIDHAPLPGAFVKASGRYDWPRSIEDLDFEIRHGEDHFHGRLVYHGQSISLEQLHWRRGEENIASASASIPWSPATRDLRGVLQLDQPFHAQLKVEKRPLPFWEAFLPPGRRPPPLRGTIAGECRLGGTPAHPELTLRLAGENIGFVSQPDLSPGRMEINITAKDGKAGVEARAEHADLEPVFLDLSLPFEPALWLEKPETVHDLSLSGTARMKDLRLERYAPLLPALRHLAGRVDINLNLAGTIGNPDILGGIKLTEGEIAFKNPAIGRIEDAELVVDFKHDRIGLEKGTARLGGGEVLFSGEGMIKDGATSITFRARGDHLLFWRDDSMIVRASPDLVLTGDGKAWKLSGSVPVVESIFARDVDLLPIGRSFTVPSAPTLPTFRAPPTPPEDSKVGALALDVLVEMKDPLLIRGNVARGQITGTARVGGTASNPEVDGSFMLADGVARLPLSVLRVPRGEILFQPGRGFVPEIRAVGRSKIPPYEVGVNVSGPIDNMQVHLSSEPPLPTNEVLALLATGSTTGALEDPANAQAKAAQLLVRELRDGKLPFGRRIAALLGPLDELQVQVGQESPFDGRARNGVTIEMTDRFLLTGAVDAEGNQRLTLTVLFRFR